MNPREFLTLARELAGRDDEAARRTAISRAYYAAFHQLRASARLGPRLAEVKSTSGSFKRFAGRTRPLQSSYSNFVPPGTWPTMTCTAEYLLVRWK